MTKVCVNHRDVPSATMCFQCHKPVCKSCTVLMPQGSFCSSECGILYRDMKERLKEAKPVGGGFFTKASAMFVLMVVGFMGIHGAVSFGATSLRKIDVIGLILNLVKSPKEGAGK